MQLKDFSTLEEAKSYTEKKERMVSLDMLVSFLTQHDCISLLEGSSNQKAKGLWLAINAGVSEFNLMNSHPVGQKQQQLLQYLVSVNALTQAFADTLIAYSNYSVQPFKDITQEHFEYNQEEVIDISSNTSQHIISINLNESCKKPETIKIQQKFGDSENDLTDWHDCAQFSNVRYKQSSYKAMVPANPSSYRELRIVSPVTVGITVKEV